MSIDGSAGVGRGLCAERGRGSLKLVHIGWYHLKDKGIGKQIRHVWVGLRVGSDECISDCVYTSSSILYIPPSLRECHLGLL